ncbi:MAG: hypothetical protein ABJD11_02255 [Gemmatimonadota bacterium]
MILLPAAVSLSAQSRPAERKIVSAEAKVGGSFEQLVALRELPDGRVLVTDVGPRSVILADFKQGSLTPVGRTGQGSSEYRFPGELLAFGGDSTYIVDRGARRLLKVSPDGRIVGAVGLPDGVGGPTIVRGVDRAGRIYLQGGSSDGPEGPDSAPADSVAILRWNPATGQIDSVTRIKPPAIQVSHSEGAGARAVVIRPQPYSAADGWIATSDGHVAVARAGDYHVEWFDDGVGKSGAAVPFTPVRVTDADKYRFLDAMENNRGRITIGGPAGAAASAPPPPSLEDFTWPEYKPAFVGNSGIFATPEGELWVQRYTPAADSTPVFDVFDSRGQVISTVTLPLGARLIGVGQGVLYATRNEREGHQILERYRR